MKRIDRKDVDDEKYNKSSNFILGLNNCAQLFTKVYSVPPNASSQSKIECASFKSIITNQKVSSI